MCFVVGVLPTFDLLFSGDYTLASIMDMCSLFYALELAQSESEVILAVKRLVGYLGLKESKQNATGRCARHTCMNNKYSFVDCI